MTQANSNSQDECAHLQSDQGSFLFVIILHGFFDSASGKTKALLRHTARAFTACVSDKSL